MSSESFWPASFQELWHSGIFWHLCPSAPLTTKTDLNFSVQLIWACQSLTPEQYLSKWDAYRDTKRSSWRIATHVSVHPASSVLKNARIFLPQGWPNTGTMGCRPECITGRLQQPRWRSFAMAWFPVGLVLRSRGKSIATWVPANFRRLATSQVSELINPMRSPLIPS